MAIKLSNIIESHNKKIEDSIEKVKKVYKEDTMPWIIGYSGGKDSTATLHIIITALISLPNEQRNKKVYIISSDTMVETPLIINEIEENLSKIELMAKELNLPIITHKVQPAMDNTFWVNLIGRGYPAPNQSFRWCTDRLKIEPANRFIKDIVNEYGKVIMVLGIRKGESNSRDRVIDSHTVENRDLMKHSTLTNAYVFAPIIDFNIDDVWNLLLNNNSPWGADYYSLYKLYSDSNSDSECPLVIDKEIKESAGSCGNSRFGCWACTVVNEDKALKGFINSGEKWLIPLLEYRNWLAEIRDDRSRRMKKRSNGQLYFSRIEYKNKQFTINKKGKREKIVFGEDGIDNFNNRWIILEDKNEAVKYLKSNKIDLSGEEDPRIIIKVLDGYAQLGLGPYTIECRKEMLYKLLLTEKLVREITGDKIKLVKKDELVEISRLWLEQGVWNKDVERIYKKVYNLDLNLISDDIELLNENDLNLLEEICKVHDVDLELIKKIILLEKNSVGLIRRDGIQKKLASLLTQDYLHL